MSFNQLDFFDESGYDWSGYGSPGKSIDSAGGSIGSVSGKGFGDFVLTGIESLGDVFQLVMFMPKGVGSKGG